jgi:hypothetical protein
VSGVALASRFLLGTHQPGWLARIGVPLFVSDTRLRVYKRLPAAVTSWALDSGGFTELQKHGAWTVGPGEYVARVRRYRDEIGHLSWVAPQDWMCEPLIISGGRAGPITFAGTHLSVAEHQARTVANYLELRDLAPDLPFIPVVQGWSVADYVRCVALYASHGVDLTAAPLIGVGSVCRRQDTCEAGQILAALHAVGVIRLHGFGFKTLGMLRHGHLLTSADSLAWSTHASYRPARPECVGRHRTCANCPRYALAWRESLLAALARAEHAGRQLALPLLATEAA